MFAILFEVLLKERLEEIHRFAGWEGGGLRDTKIVNKHFVNKLALPRLAFSPRIVVTSRGWRGFAPFWPLIFNHEDSSQCFRQRSRLWGQDSGKGPILLIICYVKNPPGRNSGDRHRRKCYAVADQESKPIKHSDQSACVFASLERVELLSLHGPTMLDRHLLIWTWLEPTWLWQSGWCNALYRKGWR